MIREDFFENVKYILSDGIVEGYKLQQKEVLKEIFKDKELNDSLYNEFYNNFIGFERDDNLMKTQDLMYRLDVLVDQYIVKEKGISDIDSIKDNIKELMNNYIDLYSAVDFDENYEELFEDYDFERDVNL